jgi:hypothetical protein
MFKRNCGRLDRVMRLVLGVILLPVGLLLLGGLQGNLLGQVASVIGLLALATGATGFCVLYVPFGFSTLGKRDVTP